MTQTATILVVDDEANIRLMLADTLERDGHSVVTAASGEEALPLLRNHTFDLALLDLKMSGMSGMELLHGLRHQTPDTVVIILTAHASLETAVEALRQGAFDYLFKPCKTIQLRESIRKGLQKRQRDLQQRLLLHKLEEHLSSGLENLRATMTPDPTPPAEIPAPNDEPGRFLKRGTLIVDFSRHVITLNGYLLELSPTEFDVLAYLVSEAPRVISPQELVREAQGYTGEVWDARDTVRQHIYNIRQKIKEVPHTDIIKTVRGVGYTLTEI